MFSVVFRNGADGASSRTAIWMESSAIVGIPPHSGLGTIGVSSLAGIFIPRAVGIMQSTDARSTALTNAYLKDLISSPCDNIPVALIK